MFWRKTYGKNAAYAEPENKTDTSVLKSNATRKSCGSDPTPMLHTNPLNREYSVSSDKVPSAARKQI